MQFMSQASAHRVQRMHEAMKLSSASAPGGLKIPKPGREPATGKRPLRSNEKLLSTAPVPAISAVVRTTDFRKCRRWVVWGT